MKKGLIFFLLYFLFISKGFTQSYQVLAENTGINIEAYLPLLVNEANKLIDSLPTTFQSDFKIYSIGFYLHSDKFVGGIPNEFQRAIDTVDIKSPYSILFGRQSSEKESVVKYWLRLKLPTSGIFSCYTPADLSLIHTKLNGILNSNLSVNPNSSMLEAEILMMKEFIKIVSEAKRCCLAGRSSEEECAKCPDKTADVYNLMIRYGFFEIPITELSNANKFDTIGNFEEFAQLSINQGLEQIDINSDIEGLINKMGLGMEGVSGTIFYYDPDSSNCDIILDEIISPGPEDLFSLIGKNILSRSGSSTLSKTFKITIIGSKDDNNKYRLHVRFEVPVVDHPSGKVIYLQCLDGCEMNMIDIRNRVENYYSLLGNYKTNYDYNNQIYDLVPVIQNVSFLTADQVKENTLVLIGYSSKLVDLALTTYYNLAGNLVPRIGFLPPRDELVCNFLYDCGQLEMGVNDGPRNPGHLSFVRTDIDQEYLDLFKCDTHEELIAFCAFHATGHNANINHEEIIGITSNSYMSAGSCLLWHYLGSTIIGYKCGNRDTVFFDNLEDMVESHMKTRDFEFIKKKIYERFIK